MSEILEVHQKSPPIVTARCACGRVYRTAQPYANVRRQTACAACKRHVTYPSCANRATVAR